MINRPPPSLTAAGAGDSCSNTNGLLEAQLFPHHFVGYRSFLANDGGQFRMCFFLNRQLGYLIDDLDVTL